MSDTQAPAANIIPDVIVVMNGEARGHKFVVDDDFCDRTVALGNAAGAVKCRINHPNSTGNVLSIVGEISDFYRSTCLDREGVSRPCTKARLKVYDLPNKAGDTLIALAQQASRHFGLSLDAVVEMTKKKVNGLAVAALKALNGIDVVDTPAATPSLFAADLGEGHIQLSVATHAFQTPNIVNSITSTSPNLETITMAEDIKPKDEMKPVDKTEERLAAMEAICKKMEAYMAEGAKPKDEEKPEEKADMSAKIVDGIVAKLAEQVKNDTAREFTALLAKTGGRLSEKDKAPLVAPVEDQVKLSAEQETLAKTLGLDRKMFAAEIEHTRKFLSI